MSLWAEAYNPTLQAQSFGETHDFWYSKDPSGFLLENAANGVALSPSSMLSAGAVLAAVRFLQESIALCPPSTFLVKQDGSREPDPGHYSQVLLRNPNKWQSHNRWRALNVLWQKLWGNAYNEIKPGRRHWAEELWPLHPDYMKRVDQRADGTLVYVYQAPGEDERILGQEAVLHFREVSTDGITGVEIFRLIRNTVSIALLAEKHAGMFLRKGARISALLVPESPLEPDQRRDLLSSVNESFGSSAIGLLPHGVTLQPLSMTQREAQFVELADAVVGQILRVLGVPGVVVGWMGDKTATYASAKEFFESGGIKHTILPVLTNFEAEEEKTLLPRGSRRQIKHNLDALTRANFNQRIEGLTKAAGGPFLSINEARAIEDRNAADGEIYEKPYVPSNMMGGEEEPPPPEPPPMAPPEPRRQEDEEEEARRQADVAEMRRTHAEKAEATARTLQARLVQLIRQNAARVLRREAMTLSAKATKHEKSKAKDRDTRWRAAVIEFYDSHPGYVESTMQISPEASMEYCARQAATVIRDGLQAVEGAAPKEHLVALALGGEYAEEDDHDTKKAGTEATAASA